MRMISTPGALVACSLSFLCSACGDDAGPSGVPRDRAHNTPAGAGGAAPEGDERTSTIDFDVAVPGADQPVTARVGAHGGAVEVLSYPSDVTLPLSYGSLPLGYEDAFSDAFCDSVRQQATSNDAERLLRHQGAVTALVPLSPLVAQALKSRIIDAAADATGDLADLGRRRCAARTVQHGSREASEYCLPRR